MKIDHFAIYVSDLAAARDFFVTFFGARSNDGYQNPRTGLRTFFLTFEDGNRLELMTRPEMTDAPKTPFRMGWAHLAFNVGSRERVNALTARLADAGFEVLSGPRQTGDGYYESCVSGPEGNLIEIVG